MPIPSGAPKSDLWKCPCNARKGIGPSLVVGLRDVLLPFERMLCTEAPAMQRYEGSLETSRKCLVEIGIKE